MDGYIGDFLESSLAEKKMESLSTPKNDGYAQGSFGGIASTISDVHVHARQVVNAAQNITNQANAIKLNSQEMKRVSTQARSVSTGLSEQAATIDALVKSFLNEIRNL